LHQPIRELRRRLRHECDLDVGASSRKIRSDSDSQFASCPGKNPMTNPSFSGFSIPRAASQATSICIKASRAWSRNTRPQ
jgi:hypothetical protein